MKYQTNAGAQFPQLTSKMPDAPYSYPGAFGDAYNSLRSGYEANMAMANRDAQMEFDNKSLRAQRDLALSGLSDLAQAEQNQNQLQTSRRGQQMGLVNSILSGLFR